MKKVLLAMLLIPSLASAAAPVCGNVTDLQSVTINTACQADVRAVATASLNCRAKQWSYGATTPTTFTFTFTYTYGAASVVHVYIDQSGDGLAWVPESVMSFTAGAYAPTPIDIAYTTNSTNGGFDFVYVPTTKYFRLRIVGTGANSSDLFSAVQICTQ